MKLYYEKRGQGDPIVFVHGNGEDHHTFDTTVEVLEADHTCYAVDSRGHGESPSVEELHYEDMADDMVEFLETHDLNNITFFGFSDGAIVGLLTAMKTDRIGRLVICGANTEPRGIKGWAYRMFRGAYFLTHDPKMKVMLREPHITEEQLKQITIPTLVLAGDRDMIRERETKKIAAALPNSTLRILEDATHISYVQNSTRAAIEYIAWVQDLENR